MSPADIPVHRPSSCDRVDELLDRGDGLADVEDLVARSGLSGEERDAVRRYAQERSARHDRDARRRRTSMIASAIRARRQIRR